MLRQLGAQPRPRDRRWASTSSRQLIGSAVRSRCPVTAARARSEPWAAVADRCHGVGDAPENGLPDDEQLRGLDFVCERNEWPSLRFEGGVQVRARGEAKAYLGMCPANARGQPARLL